MLDCRSVYVPLFLCICFGQWIRCRVTSGSDQHNSLQTRRKKTNELTNIRSEIHAHKLRKEKKKTGHTKNLFSSPVLKRETSLITTKWQELPVILFFGCRYSSSVFLPSIVWACHHNGEHSIDGCCLSDACVQPCSLRMLMNFKVIRRFVYI